MVIERTRPKSEQKAATTGGRVKSPLGPRSRLVKAPTLRPAQAVAEKLRKRILAAQPGAFLGSEIDLMRGLGVGRACFRQAARVLQHEQILVIKRGRSGGCFSQRPQVSAVAEAAALYLRSKKIGIRDLVVTSNILFLGAVTLACASDDEGKRHVLRDALVRLEIGGPDALVEAGLAQKGHLEAILQLASNPALELFILALDEFGLLEIVKAEVERDESHTRHLRDRTIQLYRAILSRDVPLACEAVEAMSDSVKRWVDEQPLEWPGMPKARRAANRS
jgi:GntR family transcriptional repressor for pyruvate dehydrogenase complex